MRKIKPLISFRIILLTLLILTLFVSQYCALAIASDILPEKNKTIKWDISALKVTYDDKRGLYIAEHNVIIKGGDTKLTADYLEFNNISTDVYAQGNIILTSGKDKINCDSLQINLQSETGIIYNGVLFIKENNFHITGDKIEKLAANTYKADKATLTSCSGKNPDWKISAKDIKITIEGYGFAKHATLWAKKVPVIYIPYLIFPAKVKRQTGLLSPRFASSSRKGFEYEQPLFFAIAQNQDATIYSDYMQKRGEKFAAEYRYILDTKSRGIFFLDYLHDSKIDDGTKKTSDYRFDSTPQRTNSNRYWIRSKINQGLPSDFSLKLDIDFVSDADYLHEFKNGFTGFHNTAKYFRQTFGRSIDDYDDTTRETRLNLNKTWDNKAFDINFDWFDNIIARKNNSEDTTLQTLPSIEYTSLKQKIYSSPVYYNINSGFDMFYRKDTNASLSNGKRLDIHPGFSIPYRITPYLFVEPSLGLRETAWYTKDFSHREIFDAHLNISTKILKIFNPNSDFADKIKHEIIPELKYTYIPDIDQSDLPYFNEIDRIAEENSLTWLLTQRFTTRKTSNNKNIYRDFAWIKFYQTYYFNKNNNTIKDTLSDIYFEGELSLNNYLSLGSKLAWSPYGHYFTSNETSITLSDLRGDSLHAEYRYKRKKSKSLIGILQILIIDGLNAYYSHEQDLLHGKRIQSKLGFELKKSCWSLVTSFSDTPDDKAISILIELHGIGAFGTK